MTPHSTGRENDKAPPRDRAKTLVDSLNLTPEQQPTALANALKLFEVQDSLGLPDNPAIKDAGLLCDAKFPTAKNELGLLWLCWKRESSLAEQSRVSTQSAAVARNLKNRGYVFGHDAPEGATVARRTIRRNGVEHRMITGKNECEKPSRHIQLSPANKKKFLTAKRDFLTGVRGEEIDHRVPVMACIRAGVAVAELRDSNFAEADKHFQSVSKGTNMAKKNACQKCLAGEAIPLPPCIRASGRKYKTHWEHHYVEGDPCRGCFWAFHEEGLDGGVA